MHAVPTSQFSFLLGLWQAARYGAHPPVMHLANVNPYVASTFSDWRKKQRLAAAVPRQVRITSGLELAGVSLTKCAGPHAPFVTAGGFDCSPKPAA